MPSPKTLLLTGTATALAAAVGGAAGSGADSRWFQRLDKPPFQPPPLTFPIVWTVLYADIAVTTAVAADELEEERTALLRALTVNLVLNASWTWVFFRWQRLPEAAAVAGLLTLSSGDLARRVGRASPVAGRALIPYVAWCSFATLLSGDLWRRNR